MATILFTLPLPDSIARQIDGDYADLMKYRNSELPPHISLLAPVKMDADRIPSVISALEEKLHLTNPLELDLDSVARFQGPNRVIYLQPHREPGALSPLNELHDLIENVLSDAIGRPVDDQAFVPHLTLAKDVPQDEFDDLFDSAQEEFSPIHFDVDILTVYQLSPEGQWQKTNDLKIG